MSLSVLYRICCFTGHRPQSLPWGYNESGLAFILFKNKLKKAIKSAIADGFNHFISGMALGVDMLAAELVLELKKKHPNIILECAIPCKNQSCKWQSDSVDRYNAILEQADKVTMVSDTNYFNGCMQKRNKYMIDKSERVIAVFNGTPGGTAQTIESAKKAGREVVIIKP